MTRFKHRIVASVPADRRAAVNALLERHGYGPDTFSIPLENPASRQVTHYGTDWQMDPATKSILAEILQRPGNNGVMAEGETIDEHAQRRGVARQRDQGRPPNLNR